MTHTSLQLHQLYGYSIIKDSVVAPPIGAVLMCIGMHAQNVLRSVCIRFCYGWTLRSGDIGQFMKNEGRQAD